MSFKRIIIVTLSVINIIMTLLFVPIWLEYSEALFRGQTIRLSGNNIWIDLIIILISIAILAINIILLIRYFRKKEVKFTLPFVCILIYFLIFFLPSFFADEFNYVNVNFANGALTVVADPSDLFEKKVSRWTDVSVTFKNDSQAECAVAVKSETLDKSFNVSPGLEYGIILPKGEDIVITFCGVQKIIRIN